MQIHAQNAAMPIIIATIKETIGLRDRYRL